MASAFTVRGAIQAIDRAGILLVFPLDNRPEPASLWSAFFPRSKMRWEWDQAGDTRVADLWRMREELSRSGRAVYAKWYQGRATFFSKPVFTALLKKLGDPKRAPIQENELSPEARLILKTLESDSPLSTKQLKALTGLQGKLLESSYTRGLKELFERLWVVGFGEVDDGAFPSLALGSTRSLFEGLWAKAVEMTEGEAEEALCSLPDPAAIFLRYAERSLQARARRLSRRA